MAKYADLIAVVAATQAQAEALSAMVSLRGFDQIRCMELQSAKTSMRGQTPDLVILDPEGRYDEALELLRALPPAIPVILLAETFEEEVFLSCFDAGARDFLVKPLTAPYLVSRVLVALDSRRLKEQMAQKDMVLRELGILSADSNVFNTEYMVKWLKREVARLSMDNLPTLSLLILHLDGFDAGNPEQSELRSEVYQQVAQMLLQCCRGRDIVGEYFESKFAVLLPSTGLEGALSLAERIVSRLDGVTLQAQNQPVTLDVYAGVADFQDCLHYEDLLNKAAEALRQAYTAQGEKVRFLQSFVSGRQSK